jgi:PqqD family protein of HPr-rel-A system
VATKPKLRDDVSLVEFGQEAVAYDPLSGYVHYFNPMASIVLQLCDGTATVRDTITDLADAQEVERDLIAPQVRSLVDDFRRVGIVTPSAGARRLAEAHAAREDRREKVRREVPRNE